MNLIDPSLLLTKESWGGLTLWQTPQLIISKINYVYIKKSSKIKNLLLQNVY